MHRRTGRADLPLHGGHVPKWLATRMAALGRVIVEAIVLEWGRDEVLRRLSHPFWFQSLGAVMGMDWHSSGITTSVLGALKRGLAPVADELGLYVCGGRGKQSLKTPAELGLIGARVGLDGAALARTSRLVAKVDSAAVQDGFQLYLHGMVVAADGAWAVIQQGMAPERGSARRYHWLSEGLDGFLDDPHAGIDDATPVCERSIINLADRRAAASRAVQLELVGVSPDRLARLVAEATRARVELVPRLTPTLVLPGHHDVRVADVVSRRLAGTLAAAHEAGPRDFEALLLQPGVGARTLEALALVAEVVYGAPSRFTDPARFSYAHGGKDGHPFPVPLLVYDQTLVVMRQAVARASLEQHARLDALARLDREARRLEALVGQPGGPPPLDWDTLVERERQRSPDYGGRTVAGPARRPVAPASTTRDAPRQLRLAV